jgi:hypothetical protein
MPDDPRPAPSEHPDKDQSENLTNAHASELIDQLSARRDGVDSDARVATSPTDRTGPVLRLLPVSRRLQRGVQLLAVTMGIKPRRGLNGLNFGPQFVRLSTFSDRLPSSPPLPV